MSHIADCAQSVKPSLCHCDLLHYTCHCDFNHDGAISSHGCQMQSSAVSYADDPSISSVSTIPSSSNTKIQAKMNRHLGRGRRRRAARSIRWPSMVQTALTLLLVLVSLTARPASASQGDRSVEYQKCVASLTADSCRDHVQDGTIDAPRGRKLPYLLRVMRWSCEDDCKYHCTHMITNDAVDHVRRVKYEASQRADSMMGNGQITSDERAATLAQLVESQLSQLAPVQKQMVQYHGKWVFIRFLGAQEPLSVLFSLLNLRIHLKYLLLFRKQLPDSFPLKLVYILHTLISINAWLWSAVFHARDKNFTEKMDYFSAAAVILSALFFSSCRLFRLSPGTPRFVLLKRVCYGAFALHVVYLCIGRFDYAYNMTANIAVGMVHNMLWLIYSIKPTAFPSNPIIDRSALFRAALRASKPTSALTTDNGGSTPPVPVQTPVGPSSSSPKARKRLQLILGLMTAAVCLELFDFPPILRLLDAHALWHLATVPITEMWYKWLIDDAKECVSTCWWLGEVHLAPPVAIHAATALGKAHAWVTETLKGRAAVLAQNIELHTLTTKLNELANKAGFSANTGLGINGLSTASHPTSLLKGTASSTGIALGASSSLLTVMTDREREKGKKLGERAMV